MESVTRKWIYGSTKMKIKIEMITKMKMKMIGMGTELEILKMLSDLLIAEIVRKGTNCPEVI